MTIRNMISKRTNQAKVSYVALHAYLGRHATVEGFVDTVHLATPVKMKVICAGLPKTGTTSLAKALQVLGYNVYDFMEHLTFHQREWIDSFETDRLPNFKEMYEGVDAITDMPPVFWFEEIAAVFPEAKVILTVRDSEEQWLESYKRQRQLSKEIPSYVKIAFWWNNVTRFLRTSRTAIFGGSNPKATALFRKKYCQHNERVQAVIPAERLLVFNVKQGWKPLCEFLGCDIPSSQFPQANAGQAGSKKNLAMYAAKIKSRIAYVCLLGILLFVAVLMAKFIRS